ncbi:Permuted papain-like amidase enzyme, YaeF/YiiX, C92 family [Lutibacter oricola]|uniref:Permuted papain-like amidase enzyme, YaeF/YiiX, C92 family n=1 Tax=Lutibacter oricola TaxID=762486 RepID=A0A1H3C6R6_9FLAO|nr:YiiX/YebB-like N1pC/P60 family cysteine hydrolase [Lutibacter oricola]SDX49857.1 Permuted papain-like amidase enzyme, YaeF/YiiX, C92 family [Lutibacter oricola]
MVKRILLTACTLLALLFVVYGYYFTHLTNQNSTNIKLLKNGDLILRCGKSTESYAVHLADNNAEFSHIGILIFENNIPYVIHAVPHKLQVIKKELLSEFSSTKNASKISIYRSPFQQRIIDNFCNEVKRFYNEKYEFDNEYNLLTDKKLYCTELIVKAYKNCGINLNVQTKEFNYLFGKHSVIFPSEFTKLPFKKINSNINI